MCRCLFCSSDITFFFFFFNDTATTEIYTLSLHDALPISSARRPWRRTSRASTASSRSARVPSSVARWLSGDRKSTRLNSSHGYISYAVFCLKKKKIHEDVAPDHVEGSARWTLVAVHGVRH